MPPHEAINLFQNLLTISTSRIGASYFHLPIDNGRNIQESLYRERVYCYELYHQLRTMWPDNFPYSLGGEVDKNGHPLFRENGLLRIKPDLLVHRPGDMNRNLLVIEVKPVVTYINGIEKDMRTLTNFVRHARYHRGIYLIYGTEINKFQDLHNHMIQYAGGRGRQQVNLDTIDLYWHSHINEPAQRIAWG